MTEKNTAEEPFIPPDFEFQGVRFTWKDEKGSFEGYRPVNPPYDDLHIRVELGWVKLEPKGKLDPMAFIIGQERAEYTAYVCSPYDEDDTGIYEILTGEGVDPTPQEAIRMALEDFARRLSEQARKLLAYSDRVEFRSNSSKWLPVGSPPTWETE
ncbi:MAG: hypothetical protein WCY09_10505 [Candidatus Omnitrophota bacterium]|jgi:hypothetical protein